MRPTCYDCGVPTSGHEYARCPDCANKARRAPNDVRFCSYVGQRDANGCRLWMAGVDRDGYGLFTWRDGAGVLRQIRAHHAPFMLEGIAIPSGDEVCHSCDVTSCVERSHLWIDHHAANIADRDAKGHTARGVTSNKSCLTEHDVLAIRASGLSLRELAQRYGLNPKTIWRIRVRKTWRHV